MTGDENHRAEQEGTVLAALPNALFRVELDSRVKVLAHVSGAPRRNFVRILAGDRVSVALSPRNRTRGRITSRLE